MPIHKSPEKRMRQNERRHIINKSKRTALRREIKSYRDLKQGEESKAQYSGISSTIDKAAKKGIIHHRKAARLKSRLHRKTVNA